MNIGSQGPQGNQGGVPSESRGNIRSGGLNSSLPVLPLHTPLQDVQYNIRNNVINNLNDNNLSYSKNVDSNTVNRSINNAILNTPNQNRRIDGRGLHSQGHGPHNQQGNPFLPTLYIYIYIYICIYVYIHICIYIYICMYTYIP
jgi:hypothetical protein